MNIKEAYKLGVASGLEAGRLGDFSPLELQDEDTFKGSCYDICENKRQFAGHPGERFNAEPNAEGLWDAFEKGETSGIDRAWKERRLTKDNGDV